MIAPRYKRKFRICIVFLVLLTLVAALLGYDLVAEYMVEFSARVLPDYAREALSPVVQKQTLTEEDYRFLYLQTGLGKPAVDALRAEGDTLKLYQDAFFYQGEPHHTRVSAVTKRDRMFYRNGRAPIAPLEAGDVLVSSATHSFGWRHGHAALVLNERGDLLESVAIGLDSFITPDGISWFQTTANFMLLRLKDVSKEERAQIAAKAQETLVGVPYSLTVGVLSKKDQGEHPKHTQCAHIVWQALKNCGFDTDSNGGKVVVARDMARSPLFEVVQVYGFDPIELW